MVSSIHLPIATNRLSVGDLQMPVECWPLIGDLLTSTRHDAMKAAVRVPVLKMLQKRRQSGEPDQHLCQQVWHVAGMKVPTCDRRCAAA